jgi:acetoin utilization deacetylase AcuC-like enzyme
MHPERPERLAAIEKALSSPSAGCVDLSPREASDEEILRVHGRDHLSYLQALEGQYVQLNPETYASPSSTEIARLACGSTVDLTHRVARGEFGAGFALVRPPGHHAERDQAMGFCLLNSVAIAAAAVRAEGVDRIAIVDWDVHHGNGTQHSFEADRDTLFVSLHQYPLYPGTGAISETGTGAGEGTTVNLPLPAGCGDAEYGGVWDEIVVPVLLEFEPELILVSAGFDAHADDPLAGMLVSAGAFHTMASRVRQVAEQVCNGRLVLALEGGYDLDALGASVQSVVAALAAPESPREAFPAPTAQARALVDRFREAHGTRWKNLGG